VKTELSIRIAGEAGQGIATISSFLCTIFKKAGFNIFANMDYMSRIRGGNNFFQIRISGNPVYTLREKIDILIPLNKESIALHKNDCRDDALIFADRQKHQIQETGDAITDIPFYKLAKKAGASEKYVNTVASGFIAGFLGIDFSIVEKVLKDTFQNKGTDVVTKNIALAHAGYEYAESLHQSSQANDFKLKPGMDKEELLINGNEAIALGAIKAGMKFYSAYPMTPSTSIMNTVAHFSHHYDILVEQAEDEIAAINMAIGASFAGTRSMVGTSGGGFALMQEGISLAGITETPAVIAVSQRPGPATGFPTRTEQADLNFIIHSGHGEFAKAVFCPGTIEQCFYLTIKAFQMADKYQIPVIIMTDQYLADSVRNVPVFNQEQVKVHSYRISRAKSETVKNYKRYRLTDNGISPRAVPSWIKDAIYIDSDEHTEEGHITESGEIRNLMMEKRFIKRYQELEKDTEQPFGYYTDTADKLLIGFGSTFNVLKETCESLKDKNIGFIHISQIWPFPKNFITPILKDRQVYTVENNAGAQLAGLILRETGIKTRGSILKYDGRPFNLDLLIREIKEKILS
jgi:2-oxoglutarate ferredoxin oxidoreductase subunit alpha